MTDNLTNQKFGRLTVLRQAGKSKDGRLLWECECECGNHVTVLSKSLKAGRTKSCGCLQKEALRNRRLSHGASNSRLYKVYQGIMTRCYNPHARQYKYYGGNGVKVCLEWKYDPKNFFAWALANGYDASAARNKCTLDRINPDGDYEPSNCRWVNQKEQCNNKTNNRMVIFNGEEMSVSQFAEVTGIDYYTAYNKIVRQGLSAEEVAIGCDYKP